MIQILQGANTYVAQLPAMCGKERARPSFFITSSSSIPSVFTTVTTVIYNQSTTERLTIEESLYTKINTVSNRQVDNKQFHLLLPSGILQSTLYRLGQ